MLGLKPPHHEHNKCWFKVNFLFPPPSQWLKWDWALTAAIWSGKWASSILDLIGALRNFYKSSSPDCWDLRLFIPTCSCGTRSQCRTEQHGRTNKQEKNGWTLPRHLPDEVGESPPRHVYIASLARWRIGRQIVPELSAVWAASREKHVSRYRHAPRLSWETGSCERTTYELPQTTYAFYFGTMLSTWETFPLEKKTYCRTLRTKKSEHHTVREKWVNDQKRCFTLPTNTPSRDC